MERAILRGSQRVITAFSHGRLNVLIPGCPGRGRFRVQRCLWGATTNRFPWNGDDLFATKMRKKTCFDRGIDVCFYVYCFWPLPETIPTLYTYEYSYSLQILQFEESVQEYRMNLLSHVIRHALAVQISQGFALARGLRGRDRISQGTHWAIDPWTSGCSCHTFSWQNDTDGKSANPSMFSWCSADVQLMNDLNLRHNVMMLDVCSEELLSVVQRRCWICDRWWGWLCQSAPIWEGLLHCQTIWVSGTAESCRLTKRFSNL